MEVEKLSEKEEKKESGMVDVIVFIVFILIPNICAMWCILDMFRFANGWKIRGIFIISIIPALITSMLIQNHQKLKELDDKFDNLKKESE
jgi:low affinity Fe/Cu permease